MSKSRKQFQGIKSLALANFKSIENLLNQAKSLSELIDTLKGSPQGEETVKQLEKMKNSMLKSISELIKQTHDLFDKYEEIFE